MTVPQEAFHAVRFELYCSGIEVDPDDCVAGAVDLREAWAAGAAAEHDRIRQRISDRAAKWSREDGWSRPQLAAIDHACVVLADLIGEQQ